MHEILAGACSVFLGILLTLIFLWIVGVIIYVLFRDKFFSKADQKKYREEIEEYKTDIPQ